MQIGSNPFIVKNDNGTSSLNKTNVAIAAGVLTLAGAVVGIAARYGLSQDAITIGLRNDFAALQETSGKGYEFVATQIQTGVTYLSEKGSEMYSSMPDVGFNHAMQFSCDLVSRFVNQVATSTSSAEAEKVKNFVNFSELSRSMSETLGYLKNKVVSLG